MADARIVVLIASTIVGLAGCVPAPQADYTPEEISQLESLPELMRVLYEDLKPTWDLVDRAAPTAAELEAAGVVAVRVERAAGAVAERFAAGRPEDFAADAEQLRARARELGRAAAASDVDGVRQAVDGIGKTCDSCHAAHR